MTARTGMDTLILTLRGMVSAGTADYTIAGVSYWSDDQLQTALDRHRLDFYQAELANVPQVESGNVTTYKVYRAPYRNLEGGTAYFKLVTLLGAEAGTADYTADYSNGVVTFTADQAGTAWYLTGRAYDLNATAADVWRMKAAQAAAAFDFSTDNHSLKRSQLSVQALQMAEYYEKQALANSISTAGNTSITIERSDTW